MDDPKANNRLEIKDLTLVRGDRCLFTGLGFELNQGELAHLQGHNGSGKTTLLRTLCGLLIPESGEIRWNGENIRHLREDYTKDVLYLGHLNGIKGDLTGIENLRFSAQLDGYPLSEKEAWDILERMGLQGHEDLPVKVLSQGQKRRVALSRLMCNKSLLWLLDEPFVALDKNAVVQLQTVIQSHLQQGGMVMLTTHQDVTLITDHAKVLSLSESSEVVTDA